MRITICLGWVLSLCVAASAAEPVIEDLKFVATIDSTEQKYVTLTPPELDLTVPFDVLIALHGHGADRWQFVNEGRDECRAARDVAIKHRMLFVSPDYRARTSWMGPAAEADLVQLIETLKKNHPVQHVYLCGGSMGGTGALTFSALHPELIQGCTAMNGTANLLEYENFLDAIHESFGGDKKTIPEEYKKRSAEYWPERLTMPIGMTTGGQDTFVPPFSVQRLAKILKQLDRRVLLIHHEEGGHETNYADAIQILEHILSAESKSVGRGEPASP